MKNEEKPSGIISKGPNDPMYNKINNTLKLYEKDVSIFKELLQNADDAKATEFKFVLDEREHPKEKLFDPNLAELQGTSILVYNNGVFTEKDWESLMNFADSRKQKDITSTGTFGLGFSSNYHITDSPCILSGNKIVILDILKKYVESEETKPGRMLDFSDFNRENYSDQFSPFNIFGCDILNQNFKYYNGTLMRLPFRKKISDIKGHIFTSKEVLDLIDVFKNEVNEFLLFLKYIKDIEIWKYDIDGKQTLIFSCHKEEVGTSNHTNYVNQILEDKYNGPNEYNFKIKFKNEYNNIKEEEEWMITNVNGIEYSKDLKMEIDKREIKGKFLPFTQVAYCLNSKKIIKGKAYCFLPLPCLTKLPLHINAYFSLTSDRRGLFNGDQNDLRVKWNGIILEQVLVKTYLNLLELKKDEKEFYNIFPKSESFGTEFSKHPLALYKAIYEKTLFKNTKDQFVSLKDSFYLEESKFSPILKKFLEIEGFSIVMNIPDEILKSFHSSSVEIKRVNPSFMRNILKTKRIIPKDDLFYILEFISQDEKFEEFDGVYAVLNTKGEIQKFCLTTSEVKFYLPNEIEKKIFGEKSDFIIETSSQLNMVFENMIHSGKLNIEKISSQNIGIILNSIINSKEEIKWNKDKYSETWIKLLWERLVQGDITIDDKTIDSPIVPTTIDTLIPISNSLLIYKENISKDIYEILEKFKLRFIKPNIIPKECYKFFKDDIFGSYLEHLKYKNTRPLDHSYYKGKEHQYLNFIQENFNKKAMYNDILNQLKNLVIHETFNGEFKSFSNNSKDIFFIDFPIDPKILSKCNQFIKTDPVFLRELLKNSNIEIKKDVFYHEYVFDKLFSIDPEYIKLLIQILKDDHELISKDARVEKIREVKGKKSKGKEIKVEFKESLKEKISKLKFIDCGGIYLSPNQIFDPRNSTLKSIFNDYHKFPISENILENIDIFQTYGMKTKLDTKLFTEIISKNEKLENEVPLYEKLLKFYSENINDTEWSNILEDIKKEEWIPIEKNEWSKKNGNLFASPMMIVEKKDLEFIDSSLPICLVKDLPTKVKKVLFNIDKNKIYLQEIYQTFLRFIKGKYHQEKYLLYLEKLNDVFEKGLLKEISINLKHQECIWMGTHYMTPFFIRDFPNSTLKLPNELKDFKILKNFIDDTLIFKTSKEFLNFYHQILEFKISFHEKRNYIIPLLLNHQDLLQDVEDLKYPTNSQKFKISGELVFSESFKEYKNYELLDYELNKIAKFIHIPSLSKVIIENSKITTKVEPKEKYWRYHSLNYKIMFLMDIKRATKCYIDNSDDEYDLYSFDSEITASDISDLFSTLINDQISLINDQIPLDIQIYSSNSLFILDEKKFETINLIEKEVFDSAKEIYKFLNIKTDYKSIIKLKKERDNVFQSQKIFLHFSRSINEITFSDQKKFWYENSNEIQESNDYFFHYLKTDNSRVKRKFLGYKEMHLVINGIEEKETILMSEIIDVNKFGYNQEYEKIWERIPYCQIAVSSIIDIKDPFSFNYQAPFNNVDWKDINLGRSTNITRNENLVDLLSECYFNIKEYKEEFAKILVLRDPMSIKEQYVKRFYKNLHQSLSEYFIIQESSTDFSGLEKYGLKVLRTNLKIQKDNSFPLTIFKRNLASFGQEIPKDILIKIWVIFLKLEVDINSLPIYDAKGKYTLYNSKYMLFNEEKDQDLHDYMIDKDLSYYIKNLMKKNIISQYSYEKALEFYLNDHLDKINVKDAWKKIQKIPKLSEKFQTFKLIETNHGRKSLKEKYKIHHIQSNKLDGLLSKTNIIVMKEPKNSNLIEPDIHKLINHLKNSPQDLKEIDKRELVIALLEYVKETIKDGLSKDLVHESIGKLPFFKILTNDYEPLNNITALILQKFENNILFKLPKKFKYAYYDQNFKVLYELYNLKLIEKDSDLNELFLKNFNDLDDESFKEKILQTLMDNNLISNYSNYLRDIKFFGKNKKTPRECYDPDNTYFKELDPDNIIQENFNSSKWIEELSSVGLNTELTNEIFLKFAKEKNRKLAPVLLKILKAHPQWNNDHVQRIQFIPDGNNFFSLSQFYHSKFKDLTKYVISNYPLLKDYESLIRVVEPSFSDIEEYYNELVKNPSIEIKPTILKIYEFFNSKNYKIKNPMIFKNGFMVPANLIYFDIKEDYPNYFYSMNEDYKKFYGLFKIWGVKDLPSIKTLKDIYENCKKTLSPSETIGLCKCIKLIYELDPTYKFKQLITSKNTCIGKDDIYYIDNYSIYNYIHESDFNFIHPNLIDLVIDFKIKPFSSIIKISSNSKGITTKETKELENIFKMEEFRSPLFTLGLNNDSNEMKELEKKEFQQKVNKLEKIKIHAMKKIENLDVNKKSFLKDFKIDCIILNDKDILYIKESLLNSRELNLIIAREINRFLGFQIKDTLSILVLLESMKHKNDLSEILASFKVRKVISNDYDIKRPFGGKILKEDKNLIKKVQGPNELESNQFIVFEKTPNELIYGEVIEKLEEKFVISTKKEKFTLNYDKIYQFEKLKDEKTYSHFSIQKPFQWISKEPYEIVKNGSNIKENFQIQKKDIIIYQIQNVDLWNKFEYECQKLYLKNNSKNTLKYLYHVPTLSEEYTIDYIKLKGFDLRIQPETEWGNGIILYENINQIKVQSRYVFICYVDIGEYCVDSVPKSDYRMPPNKPKDKTYVDEKYDTIRDEKNSIYIVYDERRVYPLFLIQNSE